MCQTGAPKYVDCTLLGCGDTSTNGSVEVWVFGTVRQHRRSEMFKQSHFEQYANKHNQGLELQEQRACGPIVMLLMTTSLGAGFS